MDEPLVSKWPTRDVVVSGEFSVIDVGDRLKVEVHRGVHCHERKHCGDVGKETPFNSPLCTIGGTEDGTQTLEEQHDDDTWNEDRTEMSGVS